MGEAYIATSIQFLLHKEQLRTTGIQDDSETSYMKVSAKVKARSRFNFAPR